MDNETFEKFDVELGDIMGKYGYNWENDNTKYHELRNELVKLLDNQPK